MSLDDAAWAEQPVRGLDVDLHGRCRHWSGPNDIVATSFPCCVGWWACRECHDRTQDHAATPWPRDRFYELVVMCGGCRSRLSVHYHLSLPGDACPHCGRTWNPQCRDHADRYFAGAVERGADATRQRADATQPAEATQRADTTQPAEATTQRTG
jgi:uncharacterized CHY-type Zn-finger protein